MSQRAAKRDGRLTAVAVFLVSGLLVIVGKLVMIQGVNAVKYEKLAESQRDKVITVTPGRGTIFDREGEILAISEDVTTVYATPYQVKEKRYTAERIAKVLGEDPDPIYRKLRTRAGFVYVARKIDNTRASRLKRLKLAGIGFIDESKRLYPMNSLASQVIGLVDTDNNGQAGLELFYQDILGGRAGKVLLEMDAAGRPIPGSEKSTTDPVDGQDIRLTLDKDIQACAEGALAQAVKEYGAKAGTAIVMECNTGNVLAMANMPTFNPNERDKIDPQGMRNRAVTDIYEPGSALKVVTASAALEDGLFEPETVMDVPAQLQIADRTFKDAKPQPARQMTFTQVIAQSSNVGTILIGQKIGDRRLHRYLKRFSMGQRTGIDFPGEVGGILPDISDWSATSGATISIGQGISITPLQLACAMSVIANGGKRVAPHFLSARMTQSGVKDMGLGGIGEEIVSRETCQKTAGILLKVVSAEGTGPKAGVRYYSVAGKTGTAAKPSPGGQGYSGYMSTFVGFAPAEHPKLVALVVLDEPTPIWGGDTSAPTFAQIMGFSLQHLKVPPSWGESRTSSGVQESAGNSPAVR